MPRRLFHQPPTLREVSLLNIACHFDSYWAAWKPMFTPSDGSNTNCIEPFEYLSDDIRQELLQISAKQHLLYKHHFQLILSSNTRRLNLCLPVKVADDFSVIQTVRVRCQKLTHLSLSGLSTVADYALGGLISSLPQLVSLNLDYTRTNHNVLKAVAKNCPNLLELYIDRCITETGPDYDIQEFVHLSKRLGVPRLKEINFQSTVISVNTVVALLKNQRSLQTLGYDGPMQGVFGQMYGDEFQPMTEIRPEWICDLSSLQLVGYSHSTLSNHNENLHAELTFRCCPFVTDIRLIHLKDYKSLRHVCKLRHLKVFHVIAESILPINFKNDLLPIVMELGTGLTSLVLINVSEVNVMAVGQLCPNLESLTLILTSNTSEPDPVGGNPVACFRSLTELKIIEDDSDSIFAISEAVFLTILGNAAELRTFTLAGSNLTDNTISKANETHGFRHLQKATFDKCNSISVKAGMILLNSDNPLRKLNFYGCNNVTREYYYQLNQEAERMGFNVAIKCN